MAEKSSWVRWLLLGLAVFGAMCLSTGVVVWKFGPSAGRMAVSTAVPAGGIVTPQWRLTPPSARWRRMSAAAVANLVQKDLWLVHVDTGALITVESVSSGEGAQFVPARLAKAVLDQQRRDSTAFELVSESTFDTCGAPAVLREYRATREGIAMTYVAATYAGRGRAYDVTAWVEDHHFATVAEELRRGAMSLCAIDSDFDRAWLENFLIFSEEEPFKSAFGDDTGSPEERGERALQFHVDGIARISRRDLARFAELMLALTENATPEACAEIWRWNPRVIESRLKTLTAVEIRDWFRVARHAQRAVLDATWADDATTPDAQDEAWERATRKPALAHALGHFEPMGDVVGDVCSSGRTLFTYALTLPADEKDALLRALATYD